MKYRLGDICTITKGETGIMKAIPGAYTMVALGEANKTHNEFQFDTKAVIVPLVSSTGHGHASMKRVKYQEGKFALGSILSAVIPKDEKVVLAKYLHIYLHWNREELLVSQMKGMANVSLPMNKIADVVVIVPSIEKQKEIIDLEKKLIERELEADKLFENQLNQIENLNQAILQEAVQGKLVKQDKKDEPASVLLKRIKVEKAKSGKKEKPLPPIKPEEIPFEIPKSWVWCRINDVLTYSKGKKPANLSSKLDSKFKIPYIDIAAFEKNRIDQYTDGIKCLLCNKENILLVWDGARMGLVGTNSSGAVGSTLVSITYYSIEKNYLLYFLKMNYQLFNKNPKQSGLPHLNGGLFDSLLFPVPPIFEQKRIVAEIDRQLAKTKQLKEHIIANQKATEQLLKALLHQAFEVEESVGV